ncbi:MAG: lipoyl synthase [Candidatus Saelkia tenebricola]|nr:lipoyl synthase [Candidatus Saelkia tenebricola]
MQNILKRPLWLNKKINLSGLSEMKSVLRDFNLHTVCEEAACPNIGECFHQGEVTFMILGDICTRECKFCNVDSKIPQAIDCNEPRRIAEAVRKLNLKHVVITSVTRDDLEDGGADVFYQTILTVRGSNKDVKIEVLIPDFKGDEQALGKVIEAKPDIIGHNVETVSRLYAEVRPQAYYKRSLRVLKAVKEFNSEIYTKSSLMLGLGEEESEVLAVLRDLRKVECDFLSLGQYLRPSLKHFSVKEYIAPDRFEYYKIQALDLGFSHVESAPYVRSSYHAAEYLTGM